MAKEKDGIMTNWSSFYKEWTIKDYKLHVKSQLGFIHRIQNHTPDNGWILETGIGSGQISICLALKGYKVIGIDNQMTIIQNAKRLAEKLEAYPVFILEDIFEFATCMKTFDMIISQGVLEHFSDSQINKYMERMLLIGKRVAFSVPLDKFKNKSFGDERLMSVEKWQELMKSWRILFQNTFAEGKHLIMILEEK